MSGETTPSAWEDSVPSLAPAQAVGRAVQDLAVPRLGRAFIPLAALTLVGVARLVAGGISGEGMVLLLGGPLVGVCVMAFGLRAVQRAFGRPRQPWMAAAQAGSLFPPVFGVYAVGWLGLREMAAWAGPVSVASGVLVTALGLWFLWGWLRILELDRLAAVMTDLGVPPA